MNTLTWCANSSCRYKASSSQCFGVVYNNDVYIEFRAHGAFLE